MINWSQVLFTALATTIGGVVVFVLGQIILVLFIERIRLQARTIEEIAQALVIYSREYSGSLGVGKNLSELHEKRNTTAERELRRLAALLRSTAQTLRWYPLFELFRLVLPRKKILNASGSLIGLSNCVFTLPKEPDVCIRFEKEVKESLGIGI